MSRGTDSLIRSVAVWSGAVVDLGIVGVLAWLVSTGAVSAEPFWGVVGALVVARGSARRRATDGESGASEQGAVVDAVRAVARRGRPS